jgi:dTDP-4-amino-4,6-dideoxygalactose transaminase
VIYFGQMYLQDHNMVDRIPHSSSAVDPSDFGYILELARLNFVGRGELSKAFESALAKDFERDWATLTGSGEQAVQLALFYLRSLAGSDQNEVVVSSYVCPAVVNAILSLNLKPVYADICSGSLNLNINDVVNRRLTYKTLALICTHVGGFPDDIHAASQLGVPVISDCAQALGTQVGSRSVAAISQLSTMSFGPTKFLTAGLGGAVLSDDPEVASRVKLIATSELSPEEYQSTGFVHTLGSAVSDLNSGLGLMQLKHVTEFLARRKAISEEYDSVLKRCSRVKMPEFLSSSSPNWFRYYFFSEHAAQWVSALVREGIDARASIAHNMISYSDMPEPYPGLASMVSRVVSLPIYPSLTRAQLDRVCDAISRIARNLDDF